MCGYKWIALPRSQYHKTAYDSEPQTRLPMNDAEGSLITSFHHAEKEKAKVWKEMTILEEELLWLGDTILQQAQSRDRGEEGEWRKSGCARGWWLRVPISSQAWTWFKKACYEQVHQKFIVPGIAFVTQDILVREQKSRFGKIIASPDFLLLDDVTVNGKSVRWIDCKAFYGADVNCRRFGVQKQSSRYHEYWGNGAVLFLEGFSEGLVTMDSHACCFLSAREFMNEGYLQPLEELNQQQQKQKRW